MSISAFFAYSNERHAIYKRRYELKLSRSEWTADPILKQFRFCNIFRELDTTTIWFRENVRDKLKSSPDVLLATVLFRWFNRIKTGEAMFSQTHMLGQTAYEHFRDGCNTEVLREAVLAFCGKGPYVTGSYIIKTPDGKNKLDGVLWCVEQFAKTDPRKTAEGMLTHPWNLERTWKYLLEFPYLGDFMAYEIVSDLQYTDLLSNAPDIMTWANPGPGAMRGLNRIRGRDLNKRLHKSTYIDEMRMLLQESRQYHNWPIDWPKWDMRTVEHTLCEFDKYERVRLGEGRPRQVFKPS
jgi:hypothetical protein